jgi:phytanoyl-CoA hydroxylase
MICGAEYQVSEHDRRQFHQDGYVTLQAVLTEEELQSIEGDFADFIQGRVPHMSRDFCDMSGPYGRKFEDFSLVNAMLPRVYRPTLRDNIFERRSRSIAAQLIGESAMLDYDQFLAKRPAKPDAVFTWHQDLGYWPTGTPDTATATCSLALDHADSENGCLCVVPGSHLEPELRAHRPMHKADEGLRDGSHILSIELDPCDRIVELPLKRGDITVHDERIVHGSGGNQSPVRWRRTYIIAYRLAACVAYERSIGFTHSHNDQVNWSTHLSALR